MRASWLASLLCFWSCGGEPSTLGESAPELIGLELPDPPINADPLCGIAGQTLVLVTGSGWREPTRFCDYNLYFDNELIATQEDGFYGPPNMLFTVPSDKEPDVYELRVDLIQRDTNYNFGTGSIPFQVVRVDSVEWVDADGLSTLSPNPSQLLQAIPEAQRATLAGLRHFPDAPAYGELRRLVNIRAKLNLPCPGVPIYFKSFDPDDGSASDPPIRRARTCDDGTPVSCDNRGEPRAGILYPLPQHGFPTTAKTDAQGWAEVTFQTSMQPGDNYLVAASANPLELASVTVSQYQLRDVQGVVLPTATTKVTRMLTVWRYLRLELDSMERPGKSGILSRNWFAGDIAGSTLETRFGALGGLSTCRFQVDPRFADPHATNEYEKGSLHIDRSINPHALVLSVSKAQGYDYWPDLDPNSGEFLHTSLPPIGSPASLPDSGVDLCPSSGEFELHDDDYDALLPSSPDLAYMRDASALLQESDDLAENRLAAAFIRPVYSGGSRTVAWRPHVFEESAKDYIAPWKDCRSDQAYWCAYLQDAFQVTVPDPNYLYLRKDRDPDDQDKFVFGFAESPGLYGRPPDEPHTGAFVFLETTRDCFLPLDQYAPRRKRTALHELGHLLLACHGDSGVMCYPSIGKNSRTGIICAPPTQPLSDAQLKFTAESINKMRWLVQPSQLPPEFTFRSDQLAWDGLNGETLLCGDSTECR